MTNHRHNPRLLSYMAFVLGSLALAWAVYEGIQRVLPELRTGKSVTTTSVAGQVPGRAQYDVSKIVDAHIFGEATTSQEPDVAEAPETRLQINLKGLIASADDVLSRAIVAVDGSSTRAYSIGQPIEGTDASVHAVETGRVLLKRGNAIESLTLKKTVLEQALSPATSRSDNTETEPPLLARPGDGPLAGSSVDRLRERARRVQMNPAF